MNQKHEKALKAIENEESKLAAEAEAAEARAADAAAAVFAAEQVYGDDQGDSAWSKVEQAKRASAQAEAIVRAAQKRLEGARERNGPKRAEVQRAALQDALERCCESTWKKSLEPLVERRRKIFRDLAELELATAAIATSHDASVDEAEALAAELGIDASAALVKGRDWLSFGNGNEPGREPRRGAYSAFYVERRARGQATSVQMPAPVVIVPEPEEPVSRGLGGLREKVSEFFS
jgi:hypothetical protein